MQAAPAVRADSGQIVASMLTEQDVDDPPQIEPLLGQILQEIEQITADGAYDGERAYAIIAQRDPDIAGRDPAARDCAAER